MSRGSSESGEPGVFKTTRWTVVRRAADRGSPAAREALEALCRAYWFPLYSFVRREGYGPEDAQDLTQEFLSRVIEKNPLAVAQPERGRFRSFLLGTLRHFLSDYRKGQRALKRGAGIQPISIDAEAAETRYRLEPVDTETPQSLFERRWAETVVNETLRRLERDYHRRGQAELARALRGCLAGESDPFKSVAHRLGMTPKSFNTALNRFRNRFGLLLEKEVSLTVEDEAEVAEEVRHIIRLGLQNVGNLWESNSQ